MRIIHLINSLATGGAETLVVEMATVMQSQGHDVEIVVIGPKEGVPYGIASARQLKIRRVGSSSYDLTSLLRLRKALKKADVVHVHLFPSLYLAPLASAGVPLVYTEHSTWNRRRDRRIFRWADRYFYGRYDKLVAISAGVRDSLSDYLSSLRMNANIGLVPNGISDIYFEPASRRNRELELDLRLVAVGTLDDRKNFSDAIRAVAATPGVELSIVGDGPQKDQLYDLIDSCGVADRVHLLGPSSNVAGLMDQHHALISTSRFEGFSLVAAEAMALGLPVIGPNVPGFRDSVIHHQTGLLYEQSEGLPAIIAAIDRLRTDGALYRLLSTNALQHSEQFRISNTTAKYLAVYADALSERVATPRRRQSRNRSR